MTRARGTIGRALTALVVVAGCVGCASSTARRLDGSGPPATRAGVLQIAWRVSLHDHGLFEAAPEECASGTMAGGRLVIGSRAASVVGLRPENGQVDWVTGVSGGIDSQARFDPARGQVYLGADDGTFYAVEPNGGKIRWSYKAKGAIDRPAEIGGDLIYFSSAADRVYALEARTGKWRWQYERETPDGFTIHGYAGPRLSGGQVLAGFSDGYFVALSAGTGEVLWARSLAAASDQFVDVDSTPALVKGTAYVSSYSGGLYAIDVKDGSIRWRIGIEGVGDVTPAAGHLYFVAPRHGLHAADHTGRILWRQGLAEAGGLTPPTVVGRYLVFSGSRAGVFVVDRENGDLLEVFNPGHGICAEAMVDTEASRLYVLSNGGSLYGLNLL